jgi:hypothetical protein
MESSCDSVAVSRVGDRSRFTLALAEPAYEYGWDAEKHNEL